MTEIAIIVPVLARPGNAGPLARSLYDSTGLATLTFVLSPGDEDEFAACDETGADLIVVPWEPGPADYSKKINHAYNLVGHDLVLLGADDLRFHPGWAEAALEAAAEYDCGVIGTNDLANPLVKAGRHSTHPVVRRCYIDQHGGSVGEPGVVYHEGYSHNWCDSELVETAKARGCYLHCHSAVVEHLHPIFNRAIAMDDTYRRGQEGQQSDRALYHARQHLWQRETASV